MNRTLLACLTAGFLFGLVLSLLISRGSGIFILTTLGTALGALLGVLAQSPPSDSPATTPDVTFS